MATDVPVPPGLLSSATDTHWPHGKPARPARPGWLPPGWVALTGYTRDGHVPLYVEARAIAAVAQLPGGGCMLRVSGRVVDVTEDPAQVFGAITDTTRNLPPR